MLDPEGGVVGGDGAEEGGFWAVSVGAVGDGVVGGARSGDEDVADDRATFEEDGVAGEEFAGGVGFPGLVGGEAGVGVVAVLWIDVVGLCGHVGRSLV